MDFHFHSIFKDEITVPILIRNSYSAKNIPALRISRILSQIGMSRNRNKDCIHSTSTAILHHPLADICSDAVFPLRSGKISSRIVAIPVIERLFQKSLTLLPFWVQKLHP
ncbi:hypothetical protein LQ318_11640 [Aliifodinibius salicampi]|uniref:Uncharacterized protein n=1 Tax=Fodinibius salicampi TaxID=1920655 RepID=A0ABT3Q0G9_9BACT|nr:hypothetical protein [Fodinibius salicampi]MCW9713553.1 hypothetical protein [Fodinibius salicampi]